MSSYSHDYWGEGDVYERDYSDSYSSHPVMLNHRAFGYDESPYNHNNNQGFSFYHNRNPRDLSDSIVSPGKLFGGNTDDSSSSANDDHKGSSNRSIPLSRKPPSLSQDMFSGPNTAQRMGFTQRTPFVVTKTKASFTFDDQPNSTVLVNKRLSQLNESLSLNPFPQEIQNKDRADSVLQEITNSGAPAVKKHFPRIQPFLCEYIHSPTSNPIIQKMIAIAPDTVIPAILHAITVDDTIFIKAIKGKASCWVLQAIFMQKYIHDPVFERRLVMHAVELSTHGSGNFVIQKAVACKDFFLYNELCSCLIARLETIGFDKFGSHVAEKLIEREATGERFHRLLLWLLSQPFFVDMMYHPHGCFVVEKIAELAQDEIKTCCLRLIRWAIDTFSNGSDGRAKILNSVRLKCKLINKGFEGLPTLSQQEFIRFITNNGLKDTIGRILM